MWNGNNSFIYDHPSGYVIQEIDPDGGSGGGYLASALAYLTTSSVAKTLIDSMEQSSTVYKVYINYNDNDQAAANGDPTRVDWDPFSALVTTDGGRQTSALGLLHEFGHTHEASTNLNQYNSDAGRSDAQYDNAEERRVITQIEDPAARQLGERGRSNHAGTTYDSLGPSSIVPMQDWCRHCSYVQPQASFAN